MTGRDRELGKFITEILERKGESLGQTRRVVDCFRQIVKELSHFAIDFQMALGVLGQQSASRIEMSVLANTGEDIEHFASVGFRILDAVRRDNRQAMRPRKIDKLPVQPFLPANEMPLDFDV